MPNSPYPVGIAFMIAAICAASGSPLSADQVDYERDLKPIFQARCYACHGALKQEADLRLDTGDFLRQGGDSGPAVVPEQPDGSLLIERLSAPDEGERMPPEGEPLTAEQIQWVRNWIAQGAKSPAGEEPEADPSQHWAFLPPQRSEVPSAAGAAKTCNPIDAFVQAKLTQQGLAPRPVAAKPVLLRRVFLDLIGLPPTSEELRDFLADDSADAYGKVVDRLLADPRYGERWGRHWMDIWRYSDWYGRRDANDVRNSASQMFRWRDWIVRSINEDKGYDRMIQEMLAADEICPEDYEAGVATGYLIRNYYSLNPNDWMRSAVEHTGKAFLGLTFNCAHCHDHKYDPIEHEDYFRLRAFFEPIYIRQDRVPGEADPGMFQDYTYAGTRSVQRLGAVRVFDRQPDAATWFYTGGDERNRVPGRGSIAPGVPAFLGNQPLSIETVELPPRAWYPGLRPEIQQAATDDAAAALEHAQRQAAEAKSAAEEIPAAVREEIVQAEAAYTAAVQHAQQSGRPGALAGRQSLLLDAMAGRRIVHNGLRSLTSLEDEATLEFQLLILSDTHVNFQLAKDIQKGLTAAYLAFENGQIMAYQPGSFTAFEAGRYDFSAGQDRFHVSLVLQTDADQCLLTIRSLADDHVLVEALPIALNGWNPVGNESQAITFDARGGSVAVIDDVRLSAPATDNVPPAALVSFDFEPPTYTAGADVIGIEGWTASPSCVAPAISAVSNTAGNRTLHDLAEQLRLAQGAAQRAMLPLKAAESKVIAGHAKLASIQARIAADQAKFGDAAGTDATALARVASQREREAVLKKAEAERLAGELAVRSAEAKPADAADRAKALEAATKELMTAKSAVDEARRALADDELRETYSPLSPQFPQVSTGRRRALAQWITSPDHPLTARVAVNHIWTRHFHAPLVASMDDFGRNGARPTHPQLLDWLAVEFTQSGWSMKQLHRLMVTSETYRRLSSVGDAVANVAEDPENHLLWRMNVGRMESEVVRDSLLHCGQQLDLRMGGVELENKDALTTYRRSLYYSVYPEAGGKSALGELFDAPDPLDCYRRTSSIIPQQALALANSDLMHQISGIIVAAWNPSPRHRGEPDEVDEDEESTAFITAMFQQILSRLPTDAELDVCMEILKKQLALSANKTTEQAVSRARESLVRILFNHNDFIAIR